MNIRAKRAIQTLRDVNFLLLCYHKDKTTTEVNEIIEKLISPFKSKNSRVDYDTIKEVRTQLLEILSQECKPLTDKKLCKRHQEIENNFFQDKNVIIDNALLTLGQYYPASKTGKIRKSRIICPLTRQQILPESPRFILSCGIHLSLNGIMATDNDMIARTISAITQRDKLRINLFKLQQHNHKMQKQAGIASSMTGQVLGLIAVCKISLHLTVALIPVMPVVSFLLMPLVMGFIGMAICQYSNSKQEDILKRMIGDAPAHTSLQTFHQLHNPPASRWNLFSLCGDFSADTNKSVSHARNQAIVPR